MPKSNVNNCSQLVRIFALSSCAFLLSDYTQFCSQTVRNFALRPYAILLSDRTQFCSRTVRNFALRPLLVLIFALKPLLVPATYRATVLFIYYVSCIGQHQTVVSMVLATVLIISPRCCLGAKKTLFNVGGNATRDDIVRGLEAHHVHYTYMWDI